MAIGNNNIRSALEATGKFDIVEEFHEGANAYAFKAIQKHLNRPVFLKLCDYVSDIHDQIVSEAQLLVQATDGTAPSENIVKVYNAEILPLSGDDYFCLQMELVDGPSLLGRMSEGPSIGQQDAVRLAVKTLNGLRHLHINRVLHRDLKPSNIVLAGEVPKISDFGSAIVLSDDWNFVTASKHSVLYVPPEGWADNPSYTFGSDIYQIGMVLYELVNGPLEYEEKHYLTKKSDVLLKKLQCRFADLERPEQCDLVNKAICERAQKRDLLLHGRSPQPYYSEKVKRIVSKSTHPTISSRYANVSEFSYVLNQVNVPNWRCTDDGLYEAEAWHGFDWRVEVVPGKGTTKIVTSKAKQGTSNYRKQNIFSSNDIFDVFRLIEEMK